MGTLLLTCYRWYTISIRYTSFIVDPDTNQFTVTNYSDTITLDVSDFWVSSLGVTDQLSNTPRISLGAPNQSSGRVYVFEYSSPSWSQTQKIQPPSGLAGDCFGSSLRLWNRTRLEPYTCTPGKPLMIYGPYSIRLADWVEPTWRMLLEHVWVFPEPGF